MYKKKYWLFYANYQHKQLTLCLQTSTPCLISEHKAGVNPKHGMFRTHLPASYKKKVKERNILWGVEVVGHT